MESICCTVLDISLGCSVACLDTYAFTMNNEIVRRIQLSCTLICEIIRLSYFILRTFFIAALPVQSESLKSLLRGEQQILVGGNGSLSLVRFST